MSDNNNLEKLRGDLQNQIKLIEDKYNDLNNKVVNLEQNHNIMNDNIRNINDNFNQLHRNMDDIMTRLNNISEKMDCSSDVMMGAKENMKDMKRGMMKTIGAPIRWLAVSTVSAVFCITDKAMEVASSAKESMEDIVAEAQYQNRKKHMCAMEKE